MYFFEDMFSSVGRRLDHGFDALRDAFARRSTLAEPVARVARAAGEAFTNATDRLLSLRTRVWLMNAAPFVRPVLLCTLLLGVTVVLTVALAPRGATIDPRHAQLEGAIRARIAAANTEGRNTANAKKPARAVVPAQRPLGDLFGTPNR